MEFWNVSTRPTHQNGMGLTPLKAVRPLLRAEQSFPLLPDLPNVYAKWRELVMDYGVSGVQVHDARLVATMIVHGVTHILTFNTSDFVRYAPQGIVVVDPATV
jgi:predicted nucleic acid-binding protein